MSVWKFDLKRWPVERHVLLACAVSLAAWGGVEAYKRPREGDAPVVGVVELRGSVRAGELGAAAPVVRRIDALCGGGRIEALILRISSGGGDLSQAERIDGAIQRCRKAGVPVYASVDSIAASAAYLVASGADELWAGRYSVVGSLAVIADTAVAEDSVLQAGLVASGVDKLAVGDDRRRAAEGLAAAMGAVLRAQIEDRRPGVIGRDDLFTGKVWSGVEARDLGLVDHIGGFEDLLHARWAGGAKLSHVK